MEEFLPLLKTCGRVIYGHDAWHLGLLCLEELDYPAATRVLTDHVWGVMPDSVGEQVDTIALVWRMEMAGASLDDRWPDIGRHVAPLAGQVVIPFISAHHAYALAKSAQRDALAELLHSVRNRAAQSDEEAHLVWQTMGLRLVEGCAAFGAGDAAETRRHLGAIRDQVTAVVAVTHRSICSVRPTSAPSPALGRKRRRGFFWTR
jgi:hypothetical protein